MELAKRHEVDVLTSAGPGLSAQEHREGVNIYRAPVIGRTHRSTASILSMLSFWPIGIRHARRQLAGRAYDVVNSWFAVPSGPTGVHLARHFGAPHVLTMAGGDIYDPSKWYTPDKNPLLGAAVRRVLAASDGHVAVSTDCWRARSLYGFRGPIDVISLGAAAPQFTPAKRSDLGLDEGVVCHLGRAPRPAQEPGIADHGVASARSRGRPSAGDRRWAGARRSGGAGRADRPGPARAISGFVPEELKFQLLAASDIFALPSLHEAFGLVYLEAMHCGLPVIAARPGGHEDYLSDGRTGFLVPQEDGDALLQALERLASNPQLRLAMSAHNRTVAQRLSIVATAGEYETLFGRIGRAEAAGAVATA